MSVSTARKPSPSVALDYNEAPSPSSSPRSELTAASVGPAPGAPAPGAPLPGDVFLGLDLVTSLAAVKLCLSCFKKKDRRYSIASLPCRKAF